MKKSFGIKHIFFGQDAHIIWFFWLVIFAYILMCEDMTLPELRTEWEQLNRLREEFQDAANAFEKILDGGLNRETSSRQYHVEEIRFDDRHNPWTQNSSNSMRSL